jgi:hypothetical protein
MEVLLTILGGIFRGLIDHYFFDWLFARWWRPLAFLFVCAFILCAVIAWNVPKPY